MEGKISKVDYEQLIADRRLLIASAKHAYYNGFSKDEWEKSTIVQEFLITSKLKPNVIEHISAWIWTFRR